MIRSNPTYKLPWSISILAYNNQLHFLLCHIDEKNLTRNLNSFVVHIHLLTNHSMRNWQHNCSGIFDKLCWLVYTCLAALQSFVVFELSQLWLIFEVVKVAWCTKPRGTYNFYISDFVYRWPKVRSISWPSHYKSMGKNQVAHFHKYSLRASERS